MANNHNFKVKNGLDVIGNISVSGTVAGRNLASDGNKLDGVSTGAQPNPPASNMLTSIKTVDGANSGLDSDLLDGQHGSYYTSYTDTAIANLIDSSPGTLNTLNELAAALGDDASFSTTVTNSIATKLPLAGGTLTGDLQAAGLYVGSTNTSYDFYNNGTTYLNGATTIDDNTGINGTLTVGTSSTRNPIKIYSNSWPEVQLFKGTTEELRIGAADSSGTYNTAQGDFYIYDPTGSSMRLIVPIGASGSITRNNGAITVWDSSNDGSGSGLDADLLDGVHGSSFLRSDANDTTSGIITFGPNPGWSKYLKIGGNANNSDANSGSIGVTNGNLHLDAANGAFATYLNYYDGTGGVTFGNGASGIVAWMGPDGDLWKGSADNTGSKYWHAGNDGSGSGLDADLLDGVELSGIVQRTFADSSRNLEIRTPSTGSAGIELQASDGSFRVQLYGSAGTTYGFLDGSWGNWDIQKTVNGALQVDEGAGLVRVFNDGYHPNADKWTTSRTLSLSGDASGSVSWDGSANATLSVAVADDSHNHTWDNIDGGSVNSWSSLRVSTSNGYIDFGPANTSWAHIYTDRPNFYFNTDLYVNNQRVYHTGYHPNADTLTTARTINGVSFNGSANITVADSTKLPLTGGTLTGNLTVDSGTSTTLSVKCDNGGNAIVRAGGDGQGTGVFEVTQDNGSHGGGISYNGDGSPAFVSGESADHVTFYRISAGTRTEVFHYPYSSNTVNFNGSITLGGTVDGRDVAADGTKLDGIAANANNYSLPAGPNYIDVATSSYGTVKVDDDRGVSYAGYAIRDDWILMSNGTDYCGLYNQTDSDWAVRAQRNAEVELYHNGSMKMETRSDGITVNGNIIISGTVDGVDIAALSSTANAALPKAGGTMTGNVSFNDGYSINRVEDVWLDGKLGHYGDSDTWFRFHSSNQCEIVCANSQIATFYGSGTSGIITFSNLSYFQVNSDIRATGNITAYYSDERLKTKTGNIENAIDKVNSLEGFYYVENDLARSFGYDSNQRQVALSAQQVQAVMPECVSLAPFDIADPEDFEINEKLEPRSKSGENYLTVDYARLVPLLVEAIKDQQKQINELKERLG